MNHNSHTFSAQMDVLITSFNDGSHQWYNHDMGMLQGLGFRVNPEDRQKYKP